MAAIVMGIRASVQGIRRSARRRRAQGSSCATMRR